MPPIHLSLLSPCMLPIAGVRIGLFTPGQAFETVAQTQINKLRVPSTKIAELVTEQLNMIFQDAVLKVSWSLVMLHVFLRFVYGLLCV